ncbi:MAG: Uma2 family endonuclease [Cyanobacteria bacterium J06623_4]
MVQAVTSPLTFDNFIALYPEDGKRYELRYGEMVEMRPIGPHEEVIALIRRKLDLEIEKYNLPYFIPQTCLVKPYREAEGYLPGIIVLDKQKVKEDPYWEKASSVSTSAPIRLIVEVVSTNWQDDYLTKLAEYEKLGVPEYWVSDYRGLGGIRFIGSSKTPTVWIYELGEPGKTPEYREGRAFKEGDEIVSSIFPHLSLTVQQIIDAGR